MNKQKNDTSQFPQLLGETPTEVRRILTTLYQKSTNGKTLSNLLIAEGYEVVRSTRNILFVIDRKGYAHNLAKRIDATREDIETKLADIDIASLPLKKSRERDVSITCFLTLAEKNEIKRLAQKAELSLSGYVRQLVFGHNVQQPKASRQPLPEKRELIKLRTDLRKISGVIAQMTETQKNASGFDPIAYNQLCDQYHATLHAIMVALNQKIIT